MTAQGETCYATSGDISIAYQVIGEGPRDLIFLPGIISHVEYFHELPGYTEFLEAMASFARVIVFDKGSAARLVDGVTCPGFRSRSRC